MDLAQFWNTSGAYEIKQSLRFNSADSAYLNRTPAAGSNRRTFTLSFWIKKTGPLAAFNYGILGNYTDGSNSNEIYFNSQDRLLFYDKQSGTDYGYGWTLVFRDPSAWYHIVIVVDTTNATATDRLKLYANGVRQTDISLDYGDFPLNHQVRLLSDSYTHYIGRGYSPAEYGNYYLAEYNLIDGTALTPSSFGETDTITGAWIPKKYSGSYGANGFYLKFESSGIGTDSSGNGNTWTANNFSTSGTGTDVMSDTPTTNYPTWNPINKGPGGTGSYGSQLSDGNLVLAYNKTSGDFYATSTFGLPTTGKWYWEQRLTSTGSSFGLMGIAELNWTWNVSPRVSYLSSGKIWNAVDGSSDAQTSLSTYTTGDVIGHAWDADAGTLQFYKNGTAVGNPQAPTTTTNITFAIAFNAGSDTGWTTVLNCGQRAFEQTPPTGYKALNTANLPEPTIKDGSKYFDTKLYTANNQTAQTISGLGFSPDFLWFKTRSRAEHPYVYDRVRGAGNRISPSQTIAEITGDNSLTAFTSDGFSLGIDGAGIVNYGTDSMVAWAWDANGAGSTNNSGTITSTVSANASAGFSIVTWTGTGADGSYGHGLGVKPAMIIHKRRDSTSDWHVWHQGLPTKSPTNDVIYLNLTNAQNGGNSNLFRLDPTSSLIYTGSAGSHNVNGATYVDYVWSEVAGYSKFGSYTGNGSTTDGPFIWCGFTPRWILIKWCKDVSTAESWHIYDTARQTYNANNTILQPDSSGAEETPADRYIDILSNGFKLRQNGQQINRSGASYIFAAFAELPFKYANAR